MLRILQLSGLTSLKFMERKMEKETETEIYQHTEEFRKYVLEQSAKYKTKEAREERLSIIRNGVIQGNTFSEIGKVLGISKTRVSQLASRNGIK